MVQKDRGDKLKAYFSAIFFGSPLCPAESVKIWEYGSILIFPTKVVLCNSVTLNMSYVLVANALVSSRLDYCNSLFRSSIFVNYSASKIVQLESYQIPVDTLV